MRPRSTSSCRALSDARAAPRECFGMCRQEKGAGESWEEEAPCYSLSAIYWHLTRASVCPGMVRVKSGDTAWRGGEGGLPLLLQPCSPCPLQCRRSLIWCYQDSSHTDWIQAALASVLSSPWSCPGHFSVSQPRGHIPIYKTLLPTSSGP